MIQKYLVTEYLFITGGKFLFRIISHPQIGFSDFIQSSQLEDVPQSALSATLAI
jgi:hypothetical protein